MARGWERAGLGDVTRGVQAGWIMFLPGGPMDVRIGKLIGPRPNDVKLNGHSWAMMFSRASASNRLFFPARA